MGDVLNNVNDGNINITKYREGSFMWEPLLTKISALIALGIAAILIVLFPFVDKKNNHIS